MGFWKLSLLLAPFVWGAVSINLFMVGLIGPHVGLGSLSPEQSMLWGALLSIPATYASTRWVQRLLDEASK